MLTTINQFHLTIKSIVVSVGYMDPGNWATDLAGGSSYGYMLLFVILMSNLMAIVLQGLAVKLGVVSGLGTYHSFLTLVAQ